MKFINILLLLPPVICDIAKVYQPTSKSLSSQTPLDDSIQLSLYSTFLNPTDTFIQASTLQDIFDLDSDITSNTSSSSSSSSNPPFPEEAVLSRNQHDKTNTAISFSGGGSRSYIASVGIVAALRELGLFDKIKYVVSERKRVSREKERRRGVVSWLRSEYC